MESVKFYFDPRCPWCYQTSRWARRLEELGEIELDWGLFALEVVNLEEGKDPMELVETGSPALRTAVAIADAHGSKAVGRFYKTIGRRQFEVPPPPDDPVAAVRHALTEAGFDSGLCDAALADPKTWFSVVDATRSIVEQVGQLGVPTIVLDGGDGPAIFGPVISDMPADDDAVELWRHTSWLARYGNFAELKRKRLPQTDLPTITWRRDQKAAGAR
jgi:protein-disulfide isomerase-like protein with CxxC motif